MLRMILAVHVIEIFTLLTPRRSYRQASPRFACKLSEHFSLNNYIHIKLLILYPPLSAPRISRAMQISRPRRFEAAGRRAFGSGTRCPQRVYLFRPPCAPNFRYVRCASPDYQSRSRRAPPHAELQSACGAMRQHASSRPPPANQYICV